MTYSGGINQQIATLRERQDNVQRKVFSKWWTSHIKERGLEIKSLVDDVQDGTYLIALMEVISGEYLGKFNKKPKFPSQKAENLNMCLDYIKSKKIKLVALGPEDIMEGNEKLILGLTWVLILRYEVQKYSADTSELLKWCQSRTYGYKNVAVRDFKSSFNDGMAFCALIHKHYPDLINFSSLNPDNVADNLNLAFDVAEREFDVPKLLDANDMIGGGDEKSTITYVAKLRQAFSDKESSIAEQERLAALEAARLAEEERQRKLAEELERQRREAAAALDELLPAFADREAHERLTDEMMADYDARSSELAGWVRSKDQYFNGKVKTEAYGDTLDETQSLLDDLNNNFEKAEKPPKHQEKLALESLHGVIAARRACEGRPPFQPMVDVSQLNDLWNSMQGNEKKYKAGLLERLRRLKDLGPLMDRWRRMAARLFRWTETTEEPRTATDLGQSLPEVIVLQEKHETFASAAKANSKTHKTLRKLAERISKDPVNADEVNERMQVLNPIFDGLKNNVETRRKLLREEYERQKALEKARLAYYETADDFEDLVCDAEEYVMHPLAIDPADAVAELNKEGSRLAAILAKGPPAGMDDARGADLISRWEAVCGKLEGRVTDIHDGASKREQGDKLYKEYADSSLDFERWYEDQKKIIGFDSTATLADIKARNEKVRSNLPEGGKKLETSAALNKQLEANNLTENPHWYIEYDAMAIEYQGLSDHLKAIDASSNITLKPTDPEAVRRHLDTLADTKGSIKEAEFSDRLAPNNSAYLSSHLPAANDGGYAYNDFDTTSCGKTVPAPAPVAVKVDQGAAQATAEEKATAQAAAEEKTKAQAAAEERAKAQAAAEERAKAQAAAEEKAKAQAAAEENAKAQAAAEENAKAQAAETVEDQTESEEKPQSDEKTNETATPTGSAPPSPTKAAPQNAPTGDKSTLDDNLFMYKNQISSVPITMRYDIEVAKNKKVHFKLSFEGSTNIMLVEPAESEDDLVADVSINPFEIKTVAVIKQIDPYKPASLRMKSTWKTLEPDE